MATSAGKSIYSWKSVRATLLGLAAICGAAGPIHGQETVGGKFKLTEKTRLGKTILPAGDYKFSVRTVGTTQTLDSIHSVHQTVLVVMRPETKARPVASTFAIAWRSGPVRDAGQLVLEPGNGGMTMRSMYLGKQGLTLDFGTLSSKDKTPALAEAARPGGAPASSGTE